MVSSQRDKQQPLPFRLKGTAESLVLRGREAELRTIASAIGDDHDLLVAGPPGSGRHFLVKVAATHGVGLSFLSFEVDCLQASNTRSFVELLCKAIDSSKVLTVQEQRATMQTWLNSQDAQILWIHDETGKLNLQLDETSPLELELALETILQFMQELAEKLCQRILIFFRNFTHTHAWETDETWELRLRLRIKELPDVLYVLIGTIGELEDDMHRLSTQSKDSEVHELRQSLKKLYESGELQAVKLGPIGNEYLASFADTALAEAKLMFNPLDGSLDTFLNIVDGSFGDAVLLIDRLIARQDEYPEKTDDMRQIRVEQLSEVAKYWLEEQQAVYETILLMLPPRQAKLLTCLALDPTDKPHSRSYIERHNLYKGGAIQGALLGLKKKGLLYNVHKGVYKFTLPLLRLWIHWRNSPQVPIQNYFNHG